MILLSFWIVFIYNPATAYEDGSPMPIEDIKYTRLYCNGTLRRQMEGASGTIGASFVEGEYECYGTHVSRLNIESEPSDKVVISVTRPLAPTFGESVE